MQSNGVRMYKYCKGADVTRKSAFAYGAVIEVFLHVPRTLGESGVVLRGNRDGCGDYDVPMTVYTQNETDTVYSVELDTKALCCPEQLSGLFYYEFLFLKGFDTMFTESINNVDFYLSRSSGARFRLLIFENTYHTPSWFGKGVMYHIFVDRFCRGQGPVGTRDDAEIDPDWENGVPQYAPYPGAPVSNNVFFGGNLWGVAEKLDYLESLGVKVIYLSPIFKAYSNHKYDTGDYEHVDPMFGGDDAFKHLLAQARKKGMRVVLDGVFNHTGDDSRYFNRYGKYKELGAYQSPTSPYADWYSFRSYPDEYDSWWGIPILPRLNHTTESCRKYFTGEQGIARKYVKMGIGGWRLDVADELSNEFLDEFRAAVKDESDGECVVIGEVWENAADKIAYSKRRRYLSGKQLDSVMNYPVRNGILDFIRYRDAEGLYHVLTELYSSYPEEVCHALMNLVGTHDTERIITMLGSSEEDLDKSNDSLAAYRLSAEKRAEAMNLVKIAAALQYTVFGIPSLYYGDELGLEGARDPFCRMPMPWHDVDDPVRAELLAYYQKLGELRTTHPALDGGSFEFLYHDESSIAFARRAGGREIVVVASRHEQTVTLPIKGEFEDLLCGTRGSGALRIEPDSVLILERIGGQSI
ncbi:MAG: glycoside hydrolase family 13 protein [Clostridia bacterium]|nr:glycoside hydrolase family 13 protein [Clostridia bacterium]